MTGERGRVSAPWSAPRGADRGALTRPRSPNVIYPLALVSTVGSSATLTQTWTCGVPRKYQTNDGPSSRQLSHSPVVADVRLPCRRPGGTCRGRPASSGTPAPRPGPPCGTARAGRPAPSAAPPSGPRTSRCTGGRGSRPCRRGRRPPTPPAASSTSAFFCCLPVEHLVDLVGRHGLVPEDVAGVAGLLVEAAGGVAVEDRAAEGDVLLGVAVGAQRHVPAGHDELELVVARLAEDGDALVGAPLLAAGVVLELLEELLVVPSGLMMPLKMSWMRPCCFLV